MTPAGWPELSPWAPCWRSPPSAARHSAPARTNWVIVTLGVLTLGFAIAALIAETVWALLVPAMVGLVLTWALALLHDAGYVAPAHAARHA